jgi:hypothetical protein
MALVTPGAYGKVTLVVTSSWVVAHPAKVNPERDGFPGPLSVPPEKKLPLETAEPPFASKVTVYVAPTGVTADEGDDALEAPSAFVATTRNV